ncbi:MAG: Hpt domain-containing protein [Fidelibacterota bacterium]|nr:MAG: Hpt domain-containing protein [Candidatus Neomarinimicrobiota bacterium]
MEELASLYRKTLKERIITLESARERLQAGEADVIEIIRDIVHKLKGSGSTYGYPEITSKAEAIFEADQEIPVDRLDALLAVMRQVAFDEDSSAS